MVPWAGRINIIIVLSPVDTQGIWPDRRKTIHRLFHFNKVSLRTLASRSAGVLVAQNSGFYGQMATALNDLLSWGLPEVLVDKIAAEAHESERREIRALINMCAEYDTDPKEILVRGQEYDPDWEIRQPFTGSKDNSGYHFAIDLRCLMDYPMSFISELSDAEFDAELEEHLCALACQPDLCHY